MALLAVFDQPQPTPMRATCTANASPADAKRIGSAAEQRADTRSRHTDAAFTANSVAVCAVAPTVTSTKSG